MSCIYNVEYQKFWAFLDENVLSLSMNEGLGLTDVVCRLAVNISVGQVPSTFYRPRSLEAGVMILSQQGG